MKIYIDFDDVICETAKFFTSLAKEHFNVDVPYDNVKFFNLQKAFNLDDAQYDKLMELGHLPENLLSYKETNGAVKTINKWASKNHEIFVITGRPFSAYTASRKWLDEHDLKNIKLFCVDKYGRENFVKNCNFNMSLDELYKMQFDFAVEDSPNAFEHLLHFKNCKVAVFKRPWNKNVTLPNKNFVQCNNWQDIDNFFTSVLDAR